MCAASCTTPQRYATHIPSGVVTLHIFSKRGASWEGSGLWLGWGSRFLYCLMPVCTLYLVHVGFALARPRTAVSICMVCLLESSPRPGSKWFTVLSCFQCLSQNLCSFEFRSESLLCFATLCNAFRGFWHVTIFLIALKAPQTMQHQKPFPPIFRGIPSLCLFTRYPVDW